MAGMDVVLILLAAVAACAGGGLAVWHTVAGRRFDAALRALQVGEAEAQV